MRLTNLFCFLFVTTISNAQTFKIDNHGYVTDTSFSNWAKNKGYELVSAYVVMQQTPYIAWAKFQKKGNWGIIDLYGKEIVPAIYESIDYLGIGRNPFELIKVKKDNSIGFINLSGQLQIQPKFSEASNFSGNFAKVSFRNQTFVNKSGKILTPYKYYVLDYFHDGIAICYYENKWCLLDTNGVELPLPNYRQVKNLKNGLFSVSDKNGKWGVINHAGQELIIPKYDEVSPFSNGIARVRKDKLWSYVNTRGTEIAGEFQEALDFSEGLGAAKKNDKWGFIDSIAKPVVPFIYENCGSFSSGKAVVKISSKSFLINKANQQLTKSNYDFIVPKENGFYRFARNEKQGFLDSSGKELFLTSLKIDYKIINERIGYVENDKFGFLDKTGKIVIPALYHKIKFFETDLTTVRKANKWGVIDKNGKIVIPIKYDDIVIIVNGDIQVKINTVQDSVTSSTEAIRKPKQDNEDIPVTIDEGKYIPDMLVYIPGKWNILKKDGNLIYPFSFDEIQYDYEGIHTVILNKIKGKADRYGNTYFKVKPF